MIPRLLYVQEDHHVAATAQVEPEVVFPDVPVADIVLWLLEVNVVQAGGHSLDNQPLLLPGLEDDDAHADEGEARHMTTKHNFSQNIFKMSLYSFEESYTSLVLRPHL